MLESLHHKQLMIIAYLLGLKQVSHTLCAYTRWSRRSHHWKTSNGHSGIGMRTNLPLSAWDYAILHAILLIRFWPTTNQLFYVYQMITGFEPDVIHIFLFHGLCANCAPTMHFIGSFEMFKYLGWQQISNYCPLLRSLTGDLFTAKFVDYHFNKIVFPSLGGDKNMNVQHEWHKLSWSVPILSHLDPQLNI
jgi:hypothetical protein